MWGWWAMPGATIRAEVPRTAEGQEAVDVGTGLTAVATEEGKINQEFLTGSRYVTAEAYQV